MALGSLLLFLGLLIFVSLIVAKPLTEDRTSEVQPQNQVSHWLAERERILDALAELDADWQMGKVPKDVYPTQRRQLVAKGAHALKQLEQVDKKPKGKNGSIEKNDDVEKMIAAYKTRRKTRK
jgi:hypothetical protein